MDVLKQILIWINLRDWIKYMFSTIWWKANKRWSVKQHFHNVQKELYLVMCLYEQHITENNLNILEKWFSKHSLTFYKGNGKKTIKSDHVNPSRKWSECRQLPNVRYPYLKNPMAWKLKTNVCFTFLSAKSVERRHHPLKKSYCITTKNVI